MRCRDTDTEESSSLASYGRNPFYFPACGSRSEAVMLLRREDKRKEKLTFHSETLAKKTEELDN